MSKRYEFLEDSLIEFVPQGMASEEEPEEMMPVMVVGDPYGGAGVITGGWDGIEEFLTRALDELRKARTDVKGWREVVTEHLDNEIVDADERDRLLVEAMAGMGVIDGEVIPEQLALTS